MELHGHYRSNQVIVLIREILTFEVLNFQQNYLNCVTEIKFVDKYTTGCYLDWQFCKRAGIKCFCVVGRL